MKSDPGAHWRRMKEAQRAAAADAVKARAAPRCKESDYHNPENLCQLHAGHSGEHWYVYWRELIELK